MNQNKHLIAIVGPTASGKTAFAIQLAQQLKCAIVSADSRQFFKELSIGTAKPTLEELASAKHYFISTHSIENEYTAGQYEIDALKVIEKEFQTNDYLILTGGSGLYIDAVCKGIDDLPRDIDIRNELNTVFQAQGLAVLQEELKAKDSEYCKTIDIQNPHRVIRTLEIIRKSGKKMEHFLSNQTKKRPFNIHYFALHHDRAMLYERINQRVLTMINNGLIDEVKSVLAYKNKQALNTVGYKEVFQFLDGKISEAEMVGMIQQNTRRYAKRQITWFKREPTTLWLDAKMKENWVALVLDKINQKAK